MIKIMEKRESIKIYDTMSKSIETPSPVRDKPPWEQQLMRDMDKLKWDIENVRWDVKRISEFRIHAPSITSEDMRRIPEAWDIIDPWYVHIWISWAWTAVRHIRISTRLDIDTPQSIIIDWWGHITLTKKDKNGYNSEYEIYDQDNKRLTIVGTVFTTSNPLYLQKEAGIDEKEAAIREAKKERGDLETERDTIRKKLQQPPKPTKKLKEKDIKSLIADWKSRNDAIWKRMSTIEQNIRKYSQEKQDIQSELETLPKYISFPYIPYQSHLDTVGMRTDGMSHIWAVMTKSYRELRKIWSTSVLIDNKLWKSENRDISDIHEKVPPEVILLLNIIERMDYQVYYTTLPARKETQEVSTTTKGWKKQTKTIEVTIPAKTVLREKEEIDAMMGKQADRALTTFWINRANAFRWQRSEVGALGMAQLMPSTYKRFREKYGILRDTSIPEKHEEWAKNQEVSMKFQIMHLYDQYHSLPKWVRNKWSSIMQDPQARIWLYSILAAGYNGSMSNVIRESGLNGWWEHSIQELYPERLKERFAHNKERLTYVMKLEYLMKRYLSDMKKK